MLWPGVDSLRVLRTPARGDDRATRLADALARGSWRDDAVTLKDNQDGSVIAATLAGTPVVLKTAIVRTVTDRLKSGLGLSRHERQWSGAITLEKIGVRAAQPLALCRGFDDEHRNVETLVIEHLEGRSLIEHLRDDDLSDDDWRALTQSLAHDFEAMWLRAFNRDPKPSNIVVVREEGDIRAAFVDTVGVRRLRGFGVGSNAKLARMLASLWIEPSGARCTPSVRRAYRLVCAVCDAPQPKGNTKPGWTKAGAYRAARRLWNMSAQTVREHGDPTPTDTPFTR